MSLPQCAHRKAIIPFLSILLVAGWQSLPSHAPAKAAEVSTRLKVGLKIVPRVTGARHRMPVPPLPRPRPAGLAKR